MGRRLRQIASLGIAMLSISCSGNSPKQDSKWKSEWSYDDNYHWHDAVDPTYEYVKDKEAHVWNGGVVTVPATEHENGLMVYTCSVCGATKEEVLDKLAHTHVISSTFEHDKESHWKTCSGCDELFEMEKHHGGHATCQELAVCEVCGTQYGEYAPHVFSSFVEEEAPTCDKDGHHGYYRCEVCGKYFDENKNEATLEELSISTKEHFHDFVEKVEADCEHDGHEAYYHCDLCDKYLDENKNETTYENLKIPAKGHDYGTLIPKVDATCLEDGLAAHYHCQECDKYFDANKNEKTLEELKISAGHDYSILHNEASYYFYECEKCHEETRKTPHEWTLGSVVDGVRTDTNTFGTTREVSVWDGSSMSSSLSGTGSENDPYLIQSANDLAYFANQVTNQNIYTSKFVKLTKNIDLASNPLTIGGWASTISFAGTFDGDNHFILGMNLTSAQAANGSNVVALFPTTAASSIIKNLIVTGSVSGVGGIAGIAGYINGKVDNCINLANINATGANVAGIVGGSYSAASSITNCLNFGEVRTTTATSNAGGIMGLFAGSIEGCENHGDVIAPSTSGGIAGCGKGNIKSSRNYGSLNLSNGYGAGIVGVTNGKTIIDKCENHGTINSDRFSGGIIGTVNHKTGDEVSNSVNYGKINGNSNCIGGIIGAPLSFTTDYSAVITNCSNKGIVKGGVRVGSICGWFPGASYSSCSNEGTIIDYSSYWTGEDIRHELANRKPLIWEEGIPTGNRRIDTNQFGFTREVSIWDGTSKSSSLVGSGTSGSPYLIQSGEDLAYFANQVSNENIYSGKYVKMTISVDLDNHPLMIGGYEASKSFAGNFDGNCQFVLNMNLTSEQSSNGLGLFSTNAATSVIKNVAVTGNVSGNSGVGGIVGYINGAVENCYNFASIRASAANVGGIVGGTYINKSAINCCVNFGDIISDVGTCGGIIGLGKGSVNDSVNFGDIDSKVNTGGIVGIGTGTIYNCANFGTIIGSNFTGGIIGVADKNVATVITNATNNGQIIVPGSYVGGIVGCINSQNVANTLTNCVNNGVVKSLNGGIGGIIGSTLNESSAYQATLIDCVNNGNIQGGNKVAGIAGQLYGQYKGCTNNGEIKATGELWGDLFANGEMSEMD